MRTEKLALKLSWLVAAILVILPFHAFLTVWLSSLVGHYTLLRLWKEFLLIIVLSGSLYILAKNKALRQKLVNWWPARLIGTYSIVLLIAGLIARLTDSVTAKAMWYGLLVDLRFLAFFLAVWVITSKSSWLKNNWRSIVLSPAILVAVFAVAQYWLLPYDFLKHFGYGDQTIAPYETINHNVNHLRVASTLRGANPLGAYLLVPLTVVMVSVLRNEKRRVDGLAFGLGLVLAAAFSYSRSAWLGCTLSLAIVIWLSVRSKSMRKIMVSALVALAVVGAGLAVVLRNNATFQNTFLHTQTGTKAASSNEKHGDAFKAAGKDIIHHPLGSGVGTAGPQSYYNNKQTRIAENYYLQVGQEAGVIAMALFIAICVLVGRELWNRRADPLALALFASLIGLSLVNMLSHAWTDDTLAYVWWGLAAIAIAPALTDNKLKRK